MVTEKQRDFAQVIAETVGADLPEEQTREAYHRFIAEHIDEFYEVRDELRYKGGKTFGLEHSYTLSDGYNGDTKLNKNPE